MDYMVEGSIGEFTLPLTSRSSMSFKINPADGYAHDSTSSGKSKRQILMTSETGDAKLVDANKFFSINVSDASVLTASFLSLKAAKSKVRIICDENMSASSCTVL